jgi:hypothetical protein
LLGTSGDSEQLRQSEVGHPKSVGRLAATRDATQGELIARMTLVYMVGVVPVPKP